MCTLAAIEMIVMVFSYVKLIFAVYLFGAGIYIAGSPDFLHAFGSVFTHFGLSVLFLGILSGVLILPFKFAVRRHNRFVLLVAFFFDSIVFGVLITLALQINSYIAPLFPAALQADCLLNTPLVYTAEQCRAYYNSDRTAGFRLVWEYYFTHRSDATFNQVLTLQESVLCCGFFAPFSCIPNTNKFPATNFIGDIEPSLTSQRVFCGPYKNFYPQQSECIGYENYALGIIGGCQYDMGAGFCVTQPVTSTSLGCANITEVYVTSQLTGLVFTLIVSAMVNFMFMTIACCMWWKRKRTDVFPAFVVDQSTTVKFENVKYQYEVMPKKKLLQKENFLPDEDQLALLKVKKKKKVVVFEEKENV